MQPAVAVDQVRGAAADTVFVKRIDKSLFNLWMIRQPQVIVAAERQQPFAVDAGFDTLRGIDDAAFTIQSIRTALRQIS
jgi:hypothetical protein